GRMVSRAKGAAALLALDGIDARLALLALDGIDARVVDMRWVKPLDAEAIARAAETKLVVTVEGGILSGGVGEGVIGELARQGRIVPTLTLGVPDRFVPQGKTDHLLHDLGLDAEALPRRCGSVSDANRLLQRVVEAPSACRGRRFSLHSPRPIYAFDERFYLNLIFSLPNPDNVSLSWLRVLCLVW
uniref:transketolase C-terminal domain-containing protein n=1 Tax=Eggerthella sinensis TaxID=242230 RepID=UPI002FD80879